MKKLILIISILAFNLLTAQGGLVQIGTTVLSGFSVNNGVSNIKYLTASEVGLVSGDINTTSPFTTQEYLDARNNGINLATSIKTAYDDGFSGVILERGNYPFASNAGSTTVASGSNNISCLLTGLNDFEINFNGSTIFLIYDSNNKSPYDTSVNAAYLLPYQGFRIERSTNLTITNLEMRGDNYMRSWITGEQNDIGCYGIIIGVGTTGIKIENYIGHGFRCEPLAISAGGIGYKSLTWNSGGINKTTGADTVEVGSYSTPLVDVITPSGPYNLWNNSVTLVGSGYTRELPFRNTILQIAYYDATSTFISSETSSQNKLNYLPDGCKYVRYTAFNDERTTPTADYASTILTSGTPRSLEVNNCQFFYNMRGGIAGCANNTIIRNSVFHNIGQAIVLKKGWMAYTDTTTFAINVEDGMSDFLKIDGCRFENVDHAFLTPACQTLMFTNNISEGNSYASNINTVKYAEVSGNIFYGQNYIDGLIVLSDSDRTGRSTKVTNNTFVNSQFNAEAINDTKNNIYVSGNDYINTKVTYTGNVIATDNIHSGFIGAFANLITATDVLKFNDIIEEEEGVTTWQAYSIGSRNNKSDAVFNIKNSIARINLTNMTNVPSIHYKATTEKTISYQWDVANIITQNQHGTIYENLNLYYGSGNSYASLPDLTINFNKSEFINSRFNLARRTTVDGGDMILNFNDCSFDFSDLATLNLFVNNYSNIGGTITINFNDCTFKSTTAKTVNITSGTTIEGLTVNNNNPTYRNVTLI